MIMTQMEAIAVIVGAAALAVGCLWAGMVVGYRARLEEEAIE